MERNIYKIGKELFITSDEEIKEGDWCYQVELNDGKIDKCYDVTLYHTWTNNGVDKKIKYKKIILTTDQDLIKDGVQVIDDEFLEWFVKNPSCESVEVERLEDGQYVDRFADGSVVEGIYENYQIIIPQEEPKQDLEKEMFELEQELDIPSSMRWHNSKPKQEIKLEDIFNDEKKQGVKDLIDAHKQETIKEVAKSQAFEFSVDYKPWETDLDYREYAEYGFEKGFIAGAKLQEQRIYSEVFEWLSKKDYLTDKKDTIQKEFEQFKTK
jgi:hypothetical protein